MEGTVRLYLRVFYVFVADLACVNIQRRACSEGVERVSKENEAYNGGV